MLRQSENPLLRPKPTDTQRQIKDRHDIKRPSPRRKLLNAIHSRNAVAELQELPLPGESLHCICRGNFPLWQIVPASVRLAGGRATIEALHIATLSFNDQNTMELLAMIDAGIVGVVVLIASAFFERQNPKQYRLMADGLESRGQRLIALRSHAKIIAMAMSDGRRLVVESSANLRSCRNIEQFTMTDAPDLYAFHRGWIEEAYEAGRGEKPALGKGADHE